MQNVARLVRTAPAAAAKPSKHNRQWRKKLQRQAFAAAGIGAVACTLTGLSLSHLAHGIEIVTTAPSWEAWAMAAGIDLGFIGLEFAQITANTDSLRRTIARFTKPAIAATLAGSALMNSFAFAEHAQGWMLPAAIAMGAAVPALIFVLMRVGTALYIDCQTRG